MDLMQAKLAVIEAGKKLVETGELDKYVEQIKARETDPYTVVGNIMKDMLK